MLFEGAPCDSSNSVEVRMKDTRKDTVFPSDLDLHRAFSRLFDTLGRLGFKEASNTKCDRWSFTVILPEDKSLRTMTLSEFLQILGNHPHPLRIYSHSHWQGKNDMMALDVDIDSSSIESYVNLGAAYLRLEKYDEALKNWKKVLRLDPHHVATHLNLGNCYFQMGLLNLAIRQWIKTISLNEQSIMAHKNLASAYYQQGRFDLALQEWHKVEAILGG